ncbi:unnamed protein product, partial [Linum tenue]
PISVDVITCRQVDSYPPGKNDQQFNAAKLPTLPELMAGSGIATLYLLTYNSIQAFGWAIALFRILSNFSATGSVAGAYASAGDLICLLQSIAFLEVVHGALGLVPSGVLYPFMQWGGRTHFVLAIVRKIVEVQELPAVFITFTAWSIAESIRYSHYALNCIGRCPSWIVYLRYTAFIVLYPIGLFPGEIWLMYQALPFVKKTNLFHFTLCQAVLLSYPFLWFNLYLHMLKQRRSKLGKQNIKKKRN